MILAVDIGNSNICLGGFDGPEPTFTARLSADTKTTEDEYANKLLIAMNMRGIDKTDIEGAIISSVVPSLTSTLANAVKFIIGVEPLIVGPGIKTGVNIRCDIPSSVGADIICACVAAHCLYGSPALIIDFGTATKMTVVSENCTFVGLSIIPGIMTALHALTNKAAQLPEVSLDRVGPVIAKNTDDCIRSGVIFGNASMIDGMIERIYDEFGREFPIYVTGGIGKPIIEHCRHKMTFDENLLLKGLNFIYQKNIKK